MGVWPKLARRPSEWPVNWAGGATRALDASCSEAREAASHCCLLAAHCSTLPAWEI